MKKISLEALNIGVDSQHIDASMLAPPTQVPGVLFAHGWGGNQEQDIARAREAAGLGCVCLTFDLRGHSRTKQQRETVSREENLQDLMAAYDLFASKHSVEEQAIAVVGTSYGAYLATILTSLRPVRWLALRAPAIYKDEGWKLPKRQLHQDPDLPAYRRRQIHWQDNRALRACASFRGDVLIIESEHDDLVPHAVIANYLAAFTHMRSLTYRIISGADHALTSEASQRSNTSVLVNWLTEMITGAREDAIPPEARAASTSADGTKPIVKSPAETTAKLTAETR